MQLIRVSLDVFVIFGINYSGCQSSPSFVHPIPLMLAYGLAYTPFPFLVNINVHDGMHRLKGAYNSALFHFQCYLCKKASLKANINIITPIFEHNILTISKGPEMPAKNMFFLTKVLTK